MAARHTWTEDEVVLAISEAAEKLDGKTPTMKDVDGDVRQAALKLFGGKWSRACEAAGLTANKSLRGPQYGGGPSDEAIEKALMEPGTCRCLCGWQKSGPIGDAMQAFQAHRRDCSLIAA